MDSALAETAGLAAEALHKHSDNPFNRIIQFADRYQWVLLAAAAPFLLFPSPGRSLALLVIPIIFLVSWLARGEAIPATPLNGSLLLMALMVLVSLWATYDMGVSLPKVTGILLGFAVYFTFARYGRRADGLKWTLIALILTGLAIAGISLLGTQWTTGKFGALGKITSFFPARLSALVQGGQGFHPNEVAGVLLWVLPVMICWVITWLRQPIAGQMPGTVRKPGSLLRVQPVAASLATLFVLGVFLLTQSRTAYLALAITLFALLWLASSRPWRFVLWGIALVGLIGLVVLIRQPGGGAEPRLSLDFQFAQESGQSLVTMEQRLEVWSRAIYAIQDFPLTGMGMNVFRLAVHRLYPLFLIGPEVDLAHAHNEFLQTALDLGIPGLIAFVAVYLGAFTMLLRIYRAAPARNERVPIPAIVLGLGGGLLAHLLYGLVDTVALGAKPGVVFWMVLGLIAALYTRLTSGGEAGLTRWGLPGVARDTSQLPPAGPG